MAEECADVDLKLIPIKALKRSTRNMLGRMLDDENSIFNKKGLSRDWRGLAELADFSDEDIVRIRSFPDRTVSVLSEWQNKHLECPSVGILCNYLTQIERHDVIDDLQETFINDGRTFLLKCSVIRTPVQVPEVGTSVAAPDGWHEVMTVDDAKSETGVQQYDAYVCYTEEDQDFLLELRAQLEDKYKLKLCFKDRDLLLGCHEPSAIINLIQSRCRRLLLVITPEFLQSRHLNFQYLYAQALSIEEQRRRIIPIMYKPCKLPSNFRFLARLDYTKNDIFQCFWERLVQSIREVPQYMAPARLPGASELSTESSCSEGYASWQSSIPPPAMETNEQEQRPELSEEECVIVAKPVKKKRLLPSFGRPKRN